MDIQESQAYHSLFTTAYGVLAPLHRLPWARISRPFYVGLIRFEWGDFRDLIQGLSLWIVRKLFSALSSFFFLFFFPFFLSPIYLFLALWLGYTPVVSSEGKLQELVGRLDLASHKIQNISDDECRYSIKHQHPRSTSLNKWHLSIPFIANHRGFCMAKRCENVVRQRTGSGLAMCNICGVKVGQWRNRGRSAKGVWNEGAVADPRSEMESKEIIFVISSVVNAVLNFTFQ